MPLAGVCDNCQQNKHGACANPDACVCAMRDHPRLPPHGEVVNR